MKLKHRILIALMATSLVPLLFLGFSALYTASNSLENAAYDKLNAVREIKKSQIEQYFVARQAELEILQQSVAKIYADHDHQSSSIQKVAHDHDQYFKNFIQTFGYYDLFLIGPKGEVFYTVERESDYQSNLISGEFNNSSLAKLYSKVKDSQSYQLQDFSPYAPSNNEPAAFIAIPVTGNTKLQITVALQLSLKTINDLMMQREGMGDTGESYLVGDDLRMRSDSFLDPQGHSVMASFAGNIEDNGVDTLAVKEALTGISDSKIINDYNGNPVLSAYTPVNVNGLNWVLLSEIDEAEAMAPVQSLRNIILLLLACTLGVVSTVAFIVTRSIIKPIGGEPGSMANLAESIADGNLTYRFDRSTGNTGVYAAMDKMSANLNSVIRRISSMTVELASSASESSKIAEQANLSIAAQQYNIGNVAAAMQEMSATIKEVADNAKNVSKNTHNVQHASSEAKQDVEKTIETINVLSREINNASQAIQTVDNKSQEIGSILEVIRGIADQTNLLALNAAIEAARAGDQGRGFAVVADEVRQLAHKTKLSTSNIETMIKVLQEGVSDAVQVMNKSNLLATETVTCAEQAAAAIHKSHSEIGEITNNVTHIATAAEQQSMASEEINQAIEQISNAAMLNASGITELSSSSEHLNQLSSNLKGVTDKFIIA
ncbi:MAG: hypothetical protein OFPI_01110 [Osedax symbiont Rs2]|nr:MAG: hypothetical protein OFPI_01110 [Osedax symbiont Rs2]